MRNLCFCLIFMCLAGCLSAGGVTAAEFFGAENYKIAGTPAGDRLTVTLTSIAPPAFLDFNNSDSGRALDCFEFTQTGIVLKPVGEKESCEAELDIGLAACNASLLVVELDLNASFSFHLRGRGQMGHPPQLEYLVQITRNKADGVRLRLMTHTRNGYSTTASADALEVSFANPQTFTLSVSSTELKATFAGASVKSEARLPTGFGLALAASDGRSRVRELGLDCQLDSVWWLDAQTRFEARRALARLHEYSTQGLLAGICQSKHPSQDADLAKYSLAEIKSRETGFAAATFAARFELLDSVARALPQLATARHEAGVAALLAGYPKLSQEHLDAALVLKDCALTRLAAAEACRRLREFDAAQVHLDHAKDGLEERLQPDFELLRGRLLAARGDLSGAGKTLAAANTRWPNHQQLAAFSESASELLSPAPLASFEIAGPFGLRVVSDLDESWLNKLLGQLKPYVERIAQWLPSLEPKLEGTLAVYSSPTDYLRAALLLAGDSLDNVAGMFLPTGYGGQRSVIACRAFGEDELLRTLVHELWHLAVSSTKAGADMPPWLNEGMAVYLSAGEVSKEKTLLFAQLPSEFARIQENLAAALNSEQATKQAIGASHATFYLPNSQRLNYALAWALVWYHAQSGIADEKLLRSLIAGDVDARDKLVKVLAEVTPRMMKALKERKMIW